jgi:hypothetical protein
MMPRDSSRIRTVAEVDLHETLTLVGFFLGYSALMAVVFSSTMPFISNNWSGVWPMTLATGLFAALLGVGGLLVRPRGFGLRF